MAEKRTSKRRSSILKSLNNTNITGTDARIFEKRRVSFNREITVKEFHKHPSVPTEAVTSQEGKPPGESNESSASSRVYTTGANESFYQMSTPIEKKNRRISGVTMPSRLSIIPSADVNKSFMEDDFEVFEEESSNDVKFSVAEAINIKEQERSTVNLGIQCGELIENNFSEAPNHKGVVSNIMAEPMELPPFDEDLLLLDSNQDVPPQAGAGVGCDDTMSSPMCVPHKVDNNNHSIVDNNEMDLSTFGKEGLIGTNELDPLTFPVCLLTPPKPPTDADPPINLSGNIVKELMTIQPTPELEDPVPPHTTAASIAAEEQPVTEMGLSLSFTRNATAIAACMRIEECTHNIEDMELDSLITDKDNSTLSIHQHQVSLQGQNSTATHQASILEPKDKNETSTQQISIAKPSKTITNLHQVSLQGRNNTTIRQDSVIKPSNTSTCHQASILEPKDRNEASIQQISIAKPNEIVTDLHQVSILEPENQNEATTHDGNSMSEPVNQNETANTSQVSSIPVIPQSTTLTDITEEESDDNDEMELTCLDDSKRSLNASCSMILTEESLINIPNPLSVIREHSIDISTISVSPTSIDQPVPVTSVDKAVPVTTCTTTNKTVLVTAGDKPIPVTTRNESLLVSRDEPVLVTTTGHESVPVTTTDETVLVTTRDKTVPVTTGDEPVPVTTGHEPVPITTRDKTVLVTTGHEPVPVAFENETVLVTDGCESLPATGDEPVPVITRDETVLIPMDEPIPASTRDELVHVPVTTRDQTVLADTARESVIAGDETMKVITGCEPVPVTTGDKTVLVPRDEPVPASTRDKPVPVTTRDETVLVNTGGEPLPVTNETVLVSRDEPLHVPASTINEPVPVTTRDETLLVPRDETILVTTEDESVPVTIGNKPFPEDEILPVITNSLPVATRENTVVITKETPDNRNTIPTSKYRSTKLLPANVNNPPSLKPLVLHVPSMDNLAGKKRRPILSSTAIKSKQLAIGGASTDKTPQHVSVVSRMKSPYMTRSKSAQKNKSTTKKTKGAATHIDANSSYSLRSSSVKNVKDRNKTFTKDNAIDELVVLDYTEMKCDDVKEGENSGSSNQSVNHGHVQVPQPEPPKLLVHPESSVDASFEQHIHSPGDTSMIKQHQNVTRKSQTFIKGQPQVNEVPQDSLNNTFVLEDGMVKSMEITELSMNNTEQLTLSSEDAGWMQESISELLIPVTPTTHQDTTCTSHTPLTPHDSPTPSTPQPTATPNETPPIPSSACTVTSTETPPIPSSPKCSRKRSKSSSKKPSKRYTRRSQPPTPSPLTTNTLKSQQKPVTTTPVQPVPPSITQYTLPRMSLSSEYGEEPVKSPGIVILDGTINQTVIADDRLHCDNTTVSETGQSSSVGQDGEAMAKLLKAVPHADITLRLDEEYNQQILKYDNKGSDSVSHESDPVSDDDNITNRMSLCESITMADPQVFINNSRSHSNSPTAKSRANPPTAESKSHSMLTAIIGIADSEPSQSDFHSFVGMADSEPNQSGFNGNANVSMADSSISCSVAMLPMINRSHSHSVASIPKIDSELTLTDSQPSQFHSYSHTNLEVSDFQPTVSDSKLSITDSQHIIMTDSQPILTNAQPTLTESQPVLADSRPTISDSQPSVTDSQPMMTDSQPMMTNSQPMMTDSQADDFQSMMTNSQPTLTDSQPTIADSQPTMNDSQPVLTGSKPTMTDSQPVLTGSQPAMTDSQPMMTDSQPVLTDSQPTMTGSQTPTTTNSHPISYSTDHIVAAVANYSSNQVHPRSPEVCRMSSQQSVMYPGEGEASLSIQLSSHNESTVLYSPPDAFNINTTGICDSTNMAVADLQSPSCNDTCSFRGMEPPCTTSSCISRLEPPCGTGTAGPGSISTDLTGLEPPPCSTGSPCNTRSPCNTSSVRPEQFNINLTGLELPSFNTSNDRLPCTTNVVRSEPFSTSLTGLDLPCSTSNGGPQTTSVAKPEPFSTSLTGLEPPPCSTSITELEPSCTEPKSPYNTSMAGIEMVPCSTSISLPKKQQLFVETLEMLHSRFKVINDATRLRMVPEYSKDVDVIELVEFFNTKTTSCMYTIRCMLDYIRLNDEVESVCDIEPINWEELPNLSTDDSDISRDYLLTKALWLQMMEGVMRSVYEIYESVMESLERYFGWVVYDWTVKKVQITIGSKLKVFIYLDVEGNHAGQKIKSISYKPFSLDIDMDTKILPTSYKTVLEIPVMITSILKCV